MVVNSSGRHAVQLNAILSDTSIMQIPEMFSIDAEILERNSQDFVKRVYRINETALALAEWFRDRQEIKSVFFPGIGNDKLLYDAIMKPQSQVQGKPGYGCLMSIVLKDDLDSTKVFDSLATHKGPSLGTDYTLVCPYVLLAHYTELEWAASFGLDSRIIRISVGLEDIQHIKDVFLSAFS